MAKFDLTNRQISKGRDCVRRFCLWEQQFKSFRPKGALVWHCVPAKASKKSMLPKTQGVYAFVVKPHIIELDWSGYIVYVGKTESQNFQTRFQQYFDEPKRTKPRLWVAEMFKLWKNNLYYYYASTSATDASRFEDALLSALLPPNNERFPGTLGKMKKEIYGR